MPECGLGQREYRGLHNVLAGTGGVHYVEFWLLLDDQPDHKDVGLPGTIPDCGRPTGVLVTNENFSVHVGRPFRYCWEKEMNSRRCFMFTGNLINIERHIRFSSARFLQ